MFIEWSISYTFNFNCTLHAPQYSPSLWVRETLHFNIGAKNVSICCICTLKLFLCSFGLFDMSGLTAVYFQAGDTDIQLD